MIDNSIGAKDGGSDRTGDEDHGIDVDIRCPEWRRIADVEAVCRAAALAALRAEDRRSDCEIGIVLADNDFIADLNRRYRGREGATNVLSFPLRDGAKDAAWPHDAMDDALGDMALAWETVSGEALDQGKTPADHLRHLVVHGVLHLLGHDHMSDDEAERMEQTERRVLAGLGMSDPYEPVADDPAWGPEREARP